VTAAYAFELPTTASRSTSTNRCRVNVYANSAHSAPPLRINALAKTRGWRLVGGSRAWLAWLIAVIRRELRIRRDTGRLPRWTITCSGRPARRQVVTKVGALHAPAAVQTTSPAGRRLARTRGESAAHLLGEGGEQPVWSIARHRGRRHGSLSSFGSPLVRTEDGGREETGSIPLGHRTAAR
jgi:hypothetical protein